MTLPDERYRSIEQTRRFLFDLADPKKTPGIPKQVRERALGCLRHFPDMYHIDQAAEACPHVFQREIEAVSRLIQQYEQSQNNKVE